MASFRIRVSGFNNKTNSPFEILMPALLALENPALYPMSIQVNTGYFEVKISLLLSLDWLSTIIHSKSLNESKAFALVRQSSIS